MGGGNTEGLWCESVRRVQAGDGGGGRDRGTHPACREGGGHTLAPSPWARQQASLGSASEPQGRGGVSGEGQADRAPRALHGTQTGRRTDGQSPRTGGCAFVPLDPRPGSPGVSPGGGLRVAWSQGLGSQQPRQHPPLWVRCLPPRPAQWGSSGMALCMGLLAKLEVLVLGGPLCSPGPQQHTPSRVMEGHDAPTRSLSSLPRAGGPGSCSQAGQRGLGVQTLGQSRERAEGRLVGSAALRPASHAEE